MKNPLVSVIIPSLNGKKWLNVNLPSILKSTYSNLEIIFVSNGSKDGEAEYVQKKYVKYKSVKLLILRKNRGWAGGNNAGLTEANGDIIFFLSNDIKVDKNCLQVIVDFFLNNRDIGIIQCNSLSLSDGKTQDSGINFIDRFGFLYGFRPPKEPTEAFFAEGMAFAVKREVIDKGIKLDDYFIMEYDDVDFCWRARLAGYKVYFLPDAKVYHARGGTVGQTYFTRVTENITQYVRNHVVSIIKNYELTNLLLHLPVVVGVELGKAVYFFFRGNIKITIASLKGLFWIIKDLGIILQKRKEVQLRIRKVPDSHLFAHMVSFNLGLITPFLSAQARGKRYFIPLKYLKILGK